MTEIAAWPEVDSALQIGYDAGAMDRIRLHAGGEIAAGRTAAGLLLGERSGPRVHILGTLTLQMTAEQIRLARYRISVEGLPAIGWYVARPNGEMQLSAPELAVFHELFPSEWQFTLLLVPAESGVLNGGVFFRDAGGTLVHSDLPLPDPIPAPQPHPPMPPDPAPVRNRSESRLVSLLGWLLIAIVALLAGAAVFEFQHRHAIEVHMPHVHVPALTPKLIP